MANIKMELIDNDHVTQAKFDLGGDLEDFLREIDEELFIGKTASLEIEGLSKHLITFEISKVE
jgi:hypothetical protein